MCSLDRRTLGQFLPNPEAVRAFEQMFKAVGDTLPSTIEEANALAAQAQATAALALTMLAGVLGALEQLASAPSAPPQVEGDDHAPRAHLGTVSSQNHDTVDITGGGINGTAIGLTVAAAAKFTTMSASGQITSTVAGAAPFVVGSTIKVTNLYVDRAALADEATHAVDADHAVNADHATNASHASAADSLTSPSAYPADATDLASACALANALKAAAQSKGL